MGQKVQIIVIYWQHSEKKIASLHFNPTELIMKFAIFGNTYQAKKSSHAENLFRLLGQHNAQLCICREFHHFLTTDLHLNIPDAELFDGDDFCADMVISIGGDGTFLKAASRVGKEEYPHIGHQYRPAGFLADISPEEMEETFDESTTTTIRWKSVVYCN